MPRDYRGYPSDLFVDFATAVVAGYFPDDEEGIIAECRYGSATGVSEGDLVMFDFWQTVATSVAPCDDSSGTFNSIWNVVVDPADGPEYFGAGNYGLALEGAAQNDVLSVKLRGTFEGANIPAGASDNDILVPNGAFEMASRGGGLYGRKAVAHVLDAATSAVYFDGWRGVASPVQPRYTVTQTSATLTITDTDGIYEVLVDASSNAITITLPTLADNQEREIWFKFLDITNAVTIDGEGAETIDGNTTVSPSAQYERFGVKGNSSEWGLI